MRYYLITLLVVLFAAPIFASEKDHEEFIILDSLLLDASENEEALDNFVEYIDSLFKNNDLNKLPILTSYKGVAEALKGKYEFWPFNKLSYLNDGLELMDEAVNRDTSSLKIRYIRFNVLDKLPGILGYSSLADEEAMKLYLQLIKLTNSENNFYTTVATSLVSCERLSKNEVDALIRTYNVKSP